MKYVSVEEMVRIEKAADAAGHSYQMMMEFAGKGLADVIEQAFGELTQKRITALIGAGNNGGDTLIALHHLVEWGWEAVGYLVRSRDPKDLLVKQFQKAGGKIFECVELDGNHERLKRDILWASVLLDGVLGTGIRLPVREELAVVMGFIKQTLASHHQQSPVIVAVDCPSGIDCDTGEVDPVCQPADLTVTMAAVKQGLLKFPAFNYLGELAVVDIGLPARLPELVKIARRVVDLADVINVLPDRPLDAHKGIFGTALIAAGSESYPGAALLAAKGCYRIGTGLVTAAVPSLIYPALVCGLPEATWLVLAEKDGGISKKAVQTIAEQFGKVTSLLIGPGLGTHPDTKDFVLGVLSLPDLPPLVIDADGLRLMKMDENWWKAIPNSTVITPHPGEMAVLTGERVADIQENRVEYAEKYSTLWGITIVLKGAHTVIATPNEETCLIPAATPALARAGTGDVLAGMITGLLAQGLDPHHAASAGAWIHAQAGLQAAKWLGSSATVLASDVADAIGDVLVEIGA